jgi:hypothetical protein
MNEVSTDPAPYSNEEEEYIKYLVKKYGKKLGTKEDNYRIYD